MRVQNWVPFLVGGALGLVHATLGWQTAALVAGWAVTFGVVALALRALGRRPELLGTALQALSGEVDDLR